MVHYKPAEWLGPQGRVVGAGVAGREGFIPPAAKAWEGRQEEPAASHSADVHLIQSQGQVVLALAHPAVHIVQHLQK